MENRRTYIGLMFVLVVALVGVADVSGFSGTPSFTIDSTGWTATGNLITSRDSFTATLLLDGKVLVAGGKDDDCNALPNAELYDPVTQQWSGTGSLTAARAGHTATLLPDGKVLVAMGGDQCNDIHTAELYDPATGTWSVTGQLSTNRSQYITTLLPNGKVLVAGGLINSSPVALNSAELYDPTAGTWSPASPLNIARYDSTATLLPNGKVLALGGSGLTPWVNPLNSAELYEGGFKIPQLTLNSTTYCVGAPWEVTVTRAVGSASVRLMGTSNDAFWEIARWGVTDVDGRFGTRGTIANGTEGLHSLRVDIGGIVSNVISFAVVPCPNSSHSEFRAVGRSNVFAPLFEHSSTRSLS